MNREGFDRFFRQHYLPACRVAAGIVGPSQAEDAVQDAFYRMYTRRGRIRDEAAHAPYFYRTLTTVCLNVLRRQKTWHRIRSLFTSRHHQDPQDSLHTREAWDRLSAREKSVFLMTNVLGFEDDSAAAILTLAPSTLRVLRHRINQKIREWEETP